MDELFDFKGNAFHIINWLDTYFKSVEQYPVLSQVALGAIRNQLPGAPPNLAESYDKIMADFENILVPGITHWQSPSYFAYFPANNSIPSVWAEMLTAGLGIQAMKWLTSPAATELEQVIMDWFCQMLQLPKGFEGTIMDTASVSTLCALVAARERATGGKTNTRGINGEKLRVYCSQQAHSSIEKAVRIIGIGSDNLIKIPTDENYRMDTAALAATVESDVKMGHTPIAIVAALGTTGSGAEDPIDDIGLIAKQYNCWLHLDAAFSGSALILPEYRQNIKGLEFVDSFVFNPHKWLFTNFDCSVFFVRDKYLLTNAFSLVPEYLTDKQVDAEIDYSNWGIQLGRRFRALKLWFVIRSYGVKGLQDKLREHIRLAQLFENFINKHAHFELVVPRNLAIVCFRYLPSGMCELQTINQLNAILLQQINKTGKLFMSHTMLDDKYVLRFVCAQTNTREKHVQQACEIIANTAQNLSLS